MNWSGARTGPGANIVPEGTFWAIYFLALWAVGMLAMLAYTSLFYRYYQVLPSVPDKAAGRIYADNFHGAVRYESEEERFRLRALEDSGEAVVFLVFVTVVGLQEWKEWQTRRASKHSSGEAAPRQTSA